MAAAYRAAGMSDALIAEKLGANVDVSGDFEVWPECWQTVQVFLAMGRQWRNSFAPSGYIVREGMDFSGLAFVAGAFGVDDMQSMIIDLRIMEEAACTVFRERLERDLRK